MDENKAKTITLRDQSNYDISICKACIICGEPISLTENEYIRIKHGLSIEPGVCNECKEAVLQMRKNMEEKNNDKF